MQSAIKKRSISVGGRKTSVSLENEFWEALRDIGQSQQMPLSAMLAAIKAEYRQNSLSSAIRLFVLNHYRTHYRPPQLAASLFSNNEG
jgi:predicted DNA-binding ribbon-helix-helix protein